MTMRHDNDLRNDIVDDATSTMELNDCNDIVEVDMSSLDDIVTIVEFHIDDGNVDDIVA